MEQVIGAAKRTFPRAKIVALRPVWRTDEAGVRLSLRDTAE